MAGRAARRIGGGGRYSPRISALPRIYVTGHRNPDTDSIAAAVGYAELMGRVDPRNEYKPVRLGELNTQTRWVLERAGAPEPDFLPHVMLRVSDVMRRDFPQAGDGEPVREVGRLMAREDVDLVPVVDGDGELAGRDDRARARPPLHPRVARAVRARRADAGQRDRQGAAGRARLRRGRRGLGADLVHGDGHRLAADRDRVRRRRRRGQPRRRAARGDPAQGRPAGHEQREYAHRRGAGARARRRARRSSARRSTVT